LGRRATANIYIYIYISKGHPNICLCRHRRETGTSLQPFGNLIARRGCVVSTTSRPFCPLERSGIYCTGGWVVLGGTGLDGTENLASTGVRSSDCPARDKSLHRQHYIYVTYIHNIDIIIIQYIHNVVPFWLSALG